MAMRVDMTVEVMLNAVVDIMCSFGVVFFVAGLYWFGRTLIILCPLLFRMIYKAKVEALFFRLQLPPTLATSVGFR